MLRLLYYSEMALLKQRFNSAERKKLAASERQAYLVKQPSLKNDVTSALSRANPQWKPCHVLNENKFKDSGMIAGFTAVL